MANEFRWKAVTTYKDGTTRAFYFNEFDELDDDIELGPDWNTIETIEITYLRSSPCELPRA